MEKKQKEFRRKRGRAIQKKIIKKSSAYKKAKLQKKALGAIPVESGSARRKKNKRDNKQDLFKKEKRRSDYVGIF